MPINSYTGSLRLKEDFKDIQSVEYRISSHPGTWPVSAFSEGYEGVEGGLEEGRKHHSIFFSSFKEASLFLK